MPLSAVSHIFFTVVMKIPDMMTEVLANRQRYSTVARQPS
jgi:hypothetical protein